MYKYQRETYGKSGKITGAPLGIGSAQYHQYKHKCKHNLGQQGARYGNSFLAGIGACSAHTRIGSQHPKNGRT